MRVRVRVRVRVVCVCVRTCARVSVTLLYDLCITFCMCEVVVHCVILSAVLELYGNKTPSRNGLSNELDVIGFMLSFSPFVCVPFCVCCDQP